MLSFAYSAALDIYVYFHSAIQLLMSVRSSKFSIWHRDAIIRHRFTVLIETNNDALES